MRLPVSHWADDTVIHLGILIRCRLYSLRGGPQCLFLLISGSDVWASLVFFILIFVGRPFLILGGMFRSSVAVWDIVPPFLHLNQLVLFLNLELPNSTLPSVAIINIFMSHPASYNHDFIKSVVSYISMRDCFTKHLWPVFHELPFSLPQMLVYLGTLTWENDTCVIFVGTDLLFWFHFYTIDIWLVMVSWQINSTILLSYYTNLCQLITH